jgi:hypothetical protein
VRPLLPTLRKHKIAEAFHIHDSDGLIVRRQLALKDGPIQHTSKKVPLGWDPLTLRVF